MYTIIDRALLPKADSDEDKKKKKESSSEESSSEESSSEESSSEDDKKKVGCTRCIQCPCCFINLFHNHSPFQPNLLLSISM